MGYVENNLIDGEYIIYEAKLAWEFFIYPLAAMGLIIWFSTTVHTGLVVFTVIVFIFMLFVSYIKISTTEFGLTNMRIIAKRGFIIRNTVEIRLNQLESITISQPLDGRIFGFGTVKVSGTGGTKGQFKSINNPFELQRQVNNQISKLSK